MSSSELTDVSHKKVLSIMKERPKGKVFDAGAGRGDLSKALMKEGFEVVAGDIKPRKVGKLHIKKTDLNKILPFKKGTFDYVVAVEVMEHLENPYHAIREFGRIMKPGGELFLTTPNIANIFSRIKFLLNGTFFAFSEKERKLGHTDPLPHWQVKEILEANGFFVEEIISNQHLKLSGLNDSKTKAKRVAANMAYYALLPAVKPKNKDLLRGDSIFVIARRV